MNLKNEIFIDGTFGQLCQFANQGFADPKFAWRLSIFIGKLESFAKAFEDARRKLFLSLSGGKDTIDQGTPELVEFGKRMQELGQQEFEVNYEVGPLSEDQIPAGTNALALRAAMSIFGVFDMSS